MNYNPTMTGYTKLFGSIITSTIWRESKETKVLWITMLALATKDGIVEGSIPGLADMAKLTIEECQESLSRLMSPDEFSRTKDFDGRRIEQVDGGWKILNYRKYRDKLVGDQRREYMRLAQRRSRKRRQAAQPTDQADQTNTTNQTNDVPAVEVAEPVKPKSFPASLDEAKAMCGTLNVPAQFIEERYHLAVSRGYKDSRGARIENWPSHVQVAHSYAQNAVYERRQAIQAEADQRAKADKLSRLKEHLNSL